jgi:hypothetical protein
MIRLVLEVLKRFALKSHPQKAGADKIKKKISEQKKSPAPDPFEKYRNATRDEEEEEEKSRQESEEKAASSANKKTTSDKEKSADDNSTEKKEKNPPPLLSEDPGAKIDQAENSKSEEKL